MSSTTIILFLCATGNLVLGACLLWRRHTRVPELLFGFVVVCTSLWTYSNFALSLWVRDRYDLAVIAGRSAFVFGALGTTLYLCFSWTFPPGPANHRPRRIVALAALAVASIVILSSGTPLIQRSIQLSPFGPVYGPLFPLYQAYMLTAFIWSNFALYRSWRRSPNGRERMQIEYILAGFILAFLLVSLFIFFMPYFASRSDMAMMASGASSLCVTSMATYAIARHRLMNMGAAMRHILLHGLLSVVFGCLVFWLLHLNRVLTSGLGEGWGVFVGLVGALSLALLVSPVNAMVTRFVDYQLFEGRYDHRAALMRFGQSLATARSREGVCRVMAREIPIILRVESGAVYVVEEEDEEEGREPQTFALLAQSSGEEPGLPQALNAQQPLAALACAASEPVLRDECQLKPGQGAALVRQFADLHAELAVALRIQGRVRGILLMGEKSSGRVYTSDDLALLGMLLDQAGVALENASLHGRVVDAEQHYETVLQHMQQGVLTVDPRLRVTTLNPSGAEMLGLVPDQAPGRLLADVFPGVLPQVRASLEARQDTPPAEILVSLGGRSVPCEVETSILAGSASRVVGILVVFQDLTERKRFEERMRRMDRLASVGTLAAGVAHEIRNPLVSVKTLVQLLPERCGDPSFQHDFTALVADEVQRMTKLVNDLLEFAGPKRAEREPVDVCGVVAKVLALLEAAMIRGDVEVSLQLAESVPAAFADPGQLHQIFFNLIQNAIQAMEDGGGRITVSLGPGRFLSGESLGQEALVVRVADTGPGLDKENLDRIFDPFFTTKETGTGLGLAICHSMLEEMGALVDVESVPGNGTTFTLTLPTR